MTDLLKARVIEDVIAPTPVDERLVADDAVDRADAGDILLRAYVVIQQSGGTSVEACNE